MGWTNNVGSVVEATTVIITGTTGSGLFVYNGPPATGNLIASISATAGTDPYGNQYLPGVTSYVPGADFSQLYEGSLFLGTIVAGVPDTADEASLSLLTLTPGLPYLRLLGPAGASDTDQAVLRLIPGPPGDGQTDAGVVLLQVLDQAGTSAAAITTSGAVLKTDLAGDVLTWQTPAYSTGFAAGSTSSASYQALQFDLDGMDNLVLDGAFHFTASAPANPVFTLPVGYRPAALRNSSPLWYTTTGSDTYNGAFRLQIAANGTVNYAAATAPVSGDNVYVNWIIPMGNKQ